MWDDEECSADAIGGNLGGACACSRCAEYTFPKEIIVSPETFDEITEAIENPRPPTPELIALFKKAVPTVEETLDRFKYVFGPREMSYDDWSEFNRLKSADVAQGKRIAELIAEVASIERATIDKIAAWLEAEPSDDRCKVIALAIRGGAWR